jgi:hypothetical protein
VIDPHLLMLATEFVKKHAYLGCLEDAMLKELIALLRTTQQFTQDRDKEEQR